MTNTFQCVSYYNTRCFENIWRTYWDLTLIFCTLRFEVGTSFLPRIMKKSIAVLKAACRMDSAGPSWWLCCTVYWCLYCGVSISRFVHLLFGIRFYCCVPFSGTGKFRVDVLYVLDPPDHLLFPYTVYSCCIIFFLSTTYEAKMTRTRILFVT